VWSVGEQLELEHMYCVSESWAVYTGHVNLYRYLGCALPSMQIILILKFINFDSQRTIKGNYLIVSSSVVTICTKYPVINNFRVLFAWCIYVLHVILRTSQTLFPHSINLLTCSGHRLCSLWGTNSVILFVI